MKTSKAQLILALTCAHCGRQRHFTGEEIDVFQLMYVDAQTCDHCCKPGATLTITSHQSPVQLELEALPSIESLFTRPLSR